MDTAGLKDSWHQVAAYGDQVPLYFYSWLFVAYPETRPLFPVSMAAQRDRLVGALGHTVSNVDNVDALVPFLQGLGRDHRKFEVLAEHYPAVGAALLATLEHFLGNGWTEELAKAWSHAYTVIAQVMCEAAKEAERLEPPWWDAEVIYREQRTFDITVLTIRPQHAFGYLPGQSMAVETALRPKVWRFCSPANAPRADNSVELHIRQLPGGMVSTALAQLVQVGDVLRLGAPVGDSLTLPAGNGLGEPERSRDLLLLAGGTGLAPLKALVEQVLQEGGSRRVSLVFGARTRRELYDLKSLGQLQQHFSRFQVMPVVSEDPLHEGDQCSVVEAALKHGIWPEHEVYVCGSTQMVNGTLQQLIAAGVEPERIHYEQFASYTPLSTEAGTASLAGELS